MNKRVLVITDSIESGWIDQAGGEGREFDILALGINGEILPQLEAKKYARLSSYRIIDVSEFAQKAQDKVRKFIPSFIYEFPRKEYSGRSLIKLLRAGKGVNLWWFTEMSEKGALRTPFIKRLYSFELIRNATAAEKYDEIWVDVGDIEIIKLLSANENKLPRLRIISKPREASLFWIRVLLGAVKPQISAFARRLLLKAGKSGKTKEIPEKTVLFFSLFPYFWIKSGRGYSENFFRSVPEELGKSAPVRFAVWFSPRFSRFWKEQRELRKAAGQLQLILLENYLNLLDFISTAFLSLSYLLKVLIYRIFIQPKIKAEYEGFNINNIVKSELNHSLQSAEIFKCILMMKALGNLLKKNPVSSLIYRAEFQPHERAIVYGARGRCKTVAFQHQAIGRNHLQYQFPSEEIKRYSSNQNDPDNLPLPDKFLVAGEYPAEVLKNSGFSEADIGICGPARYAGLVNYLKQSKTRSAVRKEYGFSNDQRIFLITTPSVREEMLNLMFSLTRAMNGDGRQPTFLFKSHPVYKHDREVIEIIKNNCPDLKYSFLPDDVCLNDYLVLADALILTGTTVGVESICLGTLPILFENNATFSLNPLSEIRNAYLRVGNSQDLAGALRAVAENDAGLTNIKKNWPAAVKKIFFSLDKDPNARFCSLLKESGVLV
jgi:surface carbohydrate biosynthesis protein (TIGR04326 family)